MGRLINVALSSKRHHVFSQRHFPRFDWTNSFKYGMHDVWGLKLQNKVLQKVSCVMQASYLTWSPWGARTRWVMQAMSLRCIHDHVKSSVTSVLSLQIDLGICSSIIDPEGMQCIWLCSLPHEGLKGVACCHVWLAHTHLCAAKVSSTVPLRGSVAN